MSRLLSTSSTSFVSLSRVLLFACCLLASSCQAASQSPVVAKQLVGGLAHPWSMVFLPDGEILVSERAGTLRRIVADKLLDKPVSGLPAITARGQGGLLGLALHPQFAQNRWLYFAYAAAGQGGLSTRLARGHYQNGALTDVEVLFVATPNPSLSLKNDISLQNSHLAC